MRLVALVPLLASCAASGAVAVPPETTPAPVEPLPTPAPREDPWAVFATTILEATRAAHAAVTGAPYDAKWQCADAKRDLRSTAGQAQIFMAKGTPEFLVTVVSEIALSSSLDGAREPEPDPDDDRGEARRPQRVTIRGTPFVFADGRVRWFRLGARAAAATGDAAGVRLKQLPPEVRGALSDVVTALSSSSCTVPWVDEAELAPLPLPASTKTSAVQALDHEAAELRHACELVARAPGPWLAENARINAVYVVGTGEMATLAAPLEMDKGHVCLGRVSAYVQGP